jgi:hypothetical protein
VDGSFTSVSTMVDYKNEFNTKVLGKDSAQVQSIFSKLVFTGKGTAPKEYGSSAEVKNGGERCQRHRLHRQFAGGR